MTATALRPRAAGAAASGVGRSDRAWASASFAAMGTVVEVRVRAIDPAAHLRRAAATVRHVERLLSRHRPDSDVCALSDPGGRWVAVHPDTDEVLRRARTAAAETAGAFDPVLGALVDVWGVTWSGGADGGWAPPRPDAVADARAASGIRLLERDGLGRYRLPPGARLDLGGFAKGVAAERVRDECARDGADSVLVSIGGSSIAALGPRPDGSPWRVGLGRPDGTAGPPWGYVLLAGGAMSTSGDAHQHVEHAGRRYPHLIDPRSGEPCRSDLAAVTVVDADADADAARAEALSTALLVLGRDAALATCSRLRVAAILTGVDGSRCCTHAARDLVRVGRDR